MKLGERSEEISKNRKNKILCSHDDRGYDTFSRNYHRLDCVVSKLHGITTRIIP